MPGGAKTYLPLGANGLDLVSPTDAVARRQPGHREGKTSTRTPTEVELEPGLQTRARAHRVLEQLADHHRGAEASNEGH